jgi:hypothetical protein
MNGRTLVGAGAIAGIITGVFGLLVRGALTIDLRIGRSLRPLGPLTIGIDAPREVVFDVISAPYLGRTRGRFSGELGTDLWALGRWWGGVVARKWEAAVRASLDGVKEEAERRASRE